MAPVRVEYGPDRFAADKTLKRATKGDLNAPIRMRLQPQVLIPAEYPKPKMYLAWRNVHWAIACSNQREALQVRAALEGFFVALGEQGPEPVLRALDTLIRSGVESAASGESEQAGGE